MNKVLSISPLLITCLMATVSARADMIAYAGTVSGAFGTIDLNTGAFSSLGSSGQTLAGMAVANGMLFASSYHAANGTLFTVNTANGALASDGVATGISYDDFGSTIAGLFVVGTDADLYSVNPLNGAAMLLGTTGLALGNVRSLSTNSSALYFSNGTNLYTLNTATGAATLVGGFGGSVEISVMVTEGGVLYGADFTHNTIDTINTATGVATVGPTSAAGSILYGLAPNPIPTTSAAPEPGTLILFAGGFGCVLLFQRQRADRRS
jgi:hypothetical protein